MIITERLSLPSFTLIVDPRNIDARIDGLTRVLGARAGGSTSSEHKKLDFANGSAELNPKDLIKPKIELAINHSLRGDTKSYIDIAKNLRSIFPEMQFKSEFMDRAKQKTAQFKHVVCRGFVSVRREGVAAQDVEFLFTNDLPQDEQIVAEDALDPSHRQNVFVRSWTKRSTFVEEVLEPWIVGERIQLTPELGEVDVPFFTSPYLFVVSAISQGWTGFPIPSLLYSHSMSE